MNAFEFVVRNCNDATNRNIIIIDDDADDDFDIVDPDVDAADDVNLLHFILTVTIQMNFLPCKTGYELAFYCLLLFYCRLPIITYGTFKVINIRLLHIMK